MNYLFTAAAIGFFIGDHADQALIEGVGYHPVPSLSAEGMAQTVEGLLALYDPEVTAVQFNLLGSHDTARFLSIARGDVSALELATLFQMTYPGTPCIYYGDEIGMTGGKDPGARGSFPWSRPGAWNHDLLDYVKRTAALRHAHPALRHGRYRTLYAANRCYSFERANDHETLVVAFNASHQPQRMRIELLSGQLQPRFGTNHAYNVHEGEVTLELPARSGAVWQLESQWVFN